MNKTVLDSRSSELLIKQVQSVRSEIAYKMKQEHWVTLALVAAPLSILPALLKLAPVTLTNQDQRSVNFVVGQAHEIVYFFVSFALVILLLWVEAYCISQNNGIRRASFWIYGVERRLGLSEIPGWESFVQRPEIQKSDGTLLQRLRVALVVLYYSASTVVSCSSLMSIANRYNWYLGYWTYGLVLASALALLLIVFLKARPGLRFAGESWDESPLKLTADE